MLVYRLVGRGSSQRNNPDRSAVGLGSGRCRNRLQIALRPDIAETVGLLIGGCRVYGNADNTGAGIGSGNGGITRIVVAMLQTERPVNATRQVYLRIAPTRKQRSR